jgi:putative nucleotidyltransferase with HDIG domain
MPTFRNKRASGKYNLDKMLREIRNKVEKACKNPANPFGPNLWTGHIVNVVKYAKLLAKKLNANEEIVEIAALLHDYASALNIREFEKHHIYGAKEAEKILKKLGYPQEKIEKVKHCILAHRGKTQIKRETIEAECVASADAMAHFNAIPSLFYLAYVKHKMDMDTGAKWLRNKLKRSWDKLQPEAKELVRDKYEASKKIIE